MFPTEGLTNTLVRWAPRHNWNPYPLHVEQFLSPISGMHRNFLEANPLPVFVTESPQFFSGFGSRYCPSMAREAQISSGRPDRHTLVHDLNNDLAIIIAECDLLESTLPKEEAATSMRLKAIRRAACRMAERISASPWPAVPVSRNRKSSHRPAS